METGTGQLASLASLASLSLETNRAFKDFVSVMQFFEGSLTARLLITMGSGSSAQYQLTAEEAVQ